MHDTPWFTGLADASGSLSAYCFPFAAGDVTAFRGWALALADVVDVRAVALPGRGSRYREAPATRFDPLCDALCSAILDDGRGTPMLLGHSMGALLAFEVARRLNAAGRPPSALVVSGAVAPRLFASPWSFLLRDGDLDEDGLVRFLTETGGTPADAIADRDLLDLVLPVARADLRLVEDYRYRWPADLACPITAVRAVDDPVTPAAAHRAWSEESTAPTTFVEIDGGHMAAMTHPSMIAAIRAAAWS